MSSISIKGIVIGVLFDWVASIVLGIVLVIVAAAESGPATMEDLMRAGTSGIFAVVGFILGGAASLGAGYIAARIAGRGELINGALSGVLSAAIALLLLMPSADETMDPAMMAGFVVTPLLGFLGGYLRLRQVRGALA